MALYELDGVAPEVDPSAWIADSAQVMGRVTLAEDVSVWFGTVIRGDTESITIGRGSNIQDGTVMHADIGMPIGDLIMFLFLATLFFQPFQVLGNQYGTALTAKITHGNWLRVLEETWGA